MKNVDTIEKLMLNIAAEYGRPLADQVLYGHMVHKANKFKPEILEGAQRNDLPDTLKDLVARGLIQTKIQKLRDLRTGKVKTTTLYVASKAGIAKYNELVLGDYREQKYW